VETPNLSLETLELIKQRTPQPGFQHVDHPKLLLAIAQEMFRRHPFMGPQADRVLKSLQAAAQEYVQLHKHYVSMDNYQVFWPDIEAMLRRAAQPPPRGE
jgi:hypothetical protein